MSPGGLSAAAAALAATCLPQTPSVLPEKPPATEAWLDTGEVAKAAIAIDVASEHDVDDVLVTPGRVTFDENHVSHVVTPVSGQVVRIEGQLGAHVAKGFTLAVIASPDVGQTTADLGKADASLIAAQHAYARQRALWPARATTLGDLEQAQDALRSARAERDRAAQRAYLLHTSGAVSQSFELRSPIAGEVLARDVTPGLQVQGVYDGGTSPELFTVGDLDEVWVFSAVREQEFGRVHVGAHAELAVVGLDPFVGFVDWVSGSLDPQTRTATLRCVIRNRREQLKPEMYGAVAVSTEPLRALAVPRQAIVHLGGTTVLFFDRGLAPDARQRFERLPVTVEEDTPGFYVPVFQNVLPGDRIVTRGMEAIMARM